MLGKRPKIDLMGGSLNSGPVYRRTPASALPWRDNRQSPTRTPKARNGPVWILVCAQTRPRPSDTAGGTVFFTRSYATEHQFVYGRSMASRHNYEFYSSNASSTDLETRIYYATKTICSTLRCVKFKELSEAGRIDRQINWTLSLVQFCDGQ